MKKLITLITVFLALTINAQISEKYLDSDLTDKVNESSFICKTTADITNAGDGAYIIFRDTITLSGNFTPPANQIWQQETGAINIGSDTLFGNNTKYFSNKDRTLFYGTTGKLQGTWISPKEVYAENFGLIGDGTEFLTGGSITSSTSTLTVTGANFTSNDVGKFVSVYGAVTGFDAADPQKSQNSLQTSIVSVTNSTTVVLADNATRTVTDTEVWIGTDNFNAGKNMFYVTNQTHGTEHWFNNGDYFTSVVEYNDQLTLSTEVNGWYMGDGSDRNKILGSGRIRAIPHSLQKSRLLTIGNTHNYYVSIDIEQDWKMHNYSGEPAADTGDDFNIALYIRTAAYNGVLENMYLSNTHGTLLSSGGDLQFTNYIKGDNAANVGQRATDVDYGDINDSGVPTVDAGGDWTITSDSLDISTAVFESTRIARSGRTGNRHYQLSGSSNAGWGGLVTPEYYAYYYDADGNFLRKSGEQTFYRTYEYSDDVKFIHIKFKRSLDKEEVDIQVRAPLNPVGLTLNNVNFDQAGAHGFSNMPTNFTMNKGSVKNIYKVLPSFAGNTEDMRRAVQNHAYFGVVFENAYTGYLNWVGSVGIKVIGCTFLGTTHRELMRSDELPIALSIDQSRDFQGIGNHIEAGRIDFGRNAQLTGGNIVKNGELQIEANGVDIANIEGINTLITNIEVAAADRDVSYFRDSKMTYYRNWEGSLITDPNLHITIQDVDFKFNDITRLTNLEDDPTTYEEVVLGADSGSKMFSASPTPTEDYGGELINVNFFGARQDISVRDYENTNVYFPVTNYTNVYSESSVCLKYGLPKNRTFNNLRIDGWLRLDLDQFGGTLTGSSPVLTFNDLKVTIPTGEFNWTNTGSQILRTAAKDVDLVFNNAVFDLQVTSTEVGTYHKWMRLEHLGETTFNACEFKTESAKTWDFDDYPVGLGFVTFIDCDFENITLSGDTHYKLRYTKPHIDCPVYADNATAVADGYDVVGDVYVTSDGTIKKVY